MQAWHLGIKALAIYRDGSKTAQALRTDAHAGQGRRRRSIVEGYTQEQVDELIAEAVARRAHDRRWPRSARSATGCRASASRSRTSSRSPATRATSRRACTRTARVGEIFLTDIGKEGSTLRGMMNSFATSISIALQYGVPLDTLVEKFSYMRFEPEGITQNPEIPFAKSMPDYIMRWLASRFLDTDTQEELGILTPEVRAAQDGRGRRHVAALLRHRGPGNGGAGGHGGAGEARAPSRPARTRAGRTVAGSSPRRPARPPRR